MYVSMFAIYYIFQWKLSFKISINQLKVDNASFVYRYSRAVLKINKLLFRTSKTNYQKVKAAVLSRYENT